MAIFGLVRLGPAAASTVTPTAAVDAIKAAGAKRILNDYDFGGYLIRAAELYGESFPLRYRNAVLLSDLAGLIGLLDEYNIGATLLSPHLPAVAWFDREPGWKRLYADDIAVVQSVRRTQAPIRSGLQSSLGPDGAGGGFP